MDPFEIPITLYRHCGYSMPIGLQDAGGAAYPTEGYTFRLEISPTRSDNSWAPPAVAQQNVAGSGTSGTTFVLSDGDTSSLDYRTAYQWRVLAVAPGSDPSALVGGSVTVLDGPSVNPV